MDTATLERLKQLGACAEAVEFASHYDSLEAAWNACENAYWLLWYACRMGVAHKLIVRAACACDRTALKYLPEDEHQPRIAIETAERWCDGLATFDEVLAAYAAASTNAYYATLADAFAAAFAIADYYVIAYNAVTSAADATSIAGDPPQPLAQIVRDVIPFPKETN